MSPTPTSLAGQRAPSSKLVNVPRLITEYYAAHPTRFGVFGVNVNPHVRYVRGRFYYRLFRNPFVMFVFGPLWVLLIGQRLITRGMRPRLRNSVLGTDLALALVIAGLCWLVGWREFLLVQGPPLLLAGAAGIWLFYVQHQFEDAYWQTSDAWSFDDAALQGSSHLDLPRVLRFFTGNIGLHHVHHLSARIPNYNLQAAHEAGRLQSVTTLSLRDGIRAVRLKLWDADQRRLVTFREARRHSAF